MPPAGKLLNYAGRLVILWLLVSLWPLSAAAGPDPKDNILIFWTENERLKAVTLMSAQNYGEPVGIVAIPVFIRVRCGSGDSAVVTISEAYSRLGRRGVDRHSGRTVSSSHRRLPDHGSVHPEKGKRYRRACGHGKQIDHLW